MRFPVYSLSVESAVIINSNLNNPIRYRWAYSVGITLEIFRLSRTEAIPQTVINFRETLDLLYGYSTKSPLTYRPRLRLFGSPGSDFSTGPLEYISIRSSFLFRNRFIRYIIEKNTNKYNNKSNRLCEFGIILKPVIDVIGVTVCKSTEDRATSKTVAHK